eukprot:4238945-Pleurochrysis_carterae.AAC.1
MCSDSRCSTKGRLELSSCSAPERSSFMRVPRASRRNAKHDCESCCGFLTTQATNWRVRRRAASI